MGKARLRVCASCEFVYKAPPFNATYCPMCGFGSYSAHWVYGKKAYKYEKTQQPYIDKQVSKFVDELQTCIAAKKEAANG
jgi:hypothetical protein